MFVANCGAVWRAVGCCRQNISCRTAWPDYCWSAQYYSTSAHKLGGTRLHWVSVLSPARGGWALCPLASSHLILVTCTFLTCTCTFTHPTFTHCIAQSYRSLSSLLDCALLEAVDFKNTNWDQLRQQSKRLCLTELWSIKPMRERSKHCSLSTQFSRSACRLPKKVQYYGHVWAL